MNLHCPSCQKLLQVPEQYAGQMMKCPLCAGTFTVPSLPPPAPPVMPIPFQAPPAPPVVSSGPPQAPPASPGEAAPPSPEIPLLSSMSHTHVFSFSVRPEVVQWLAPAALLLIFLLMFLPWTDNLQAASESYSGWQLAFGEKNSALGLLHALLLILAVLVSAGVTLTPVFVPANSLPPPLSQLLPWKAVIVGGCALATFLFLALEIMAGLGPESTRAVVRTAWLRLAVFCQILAVAGAALELWLVKRGPQHPLPRVDVMW